MDVIANIKKMYRQGDGHVRVLAASIRHVDHLLGSIFLEAELATVPPKVLEEWSDDGMHLPQKGFVYNALDAAGHPLRRIPYEDIDLGQSWERFNVDHELTVQGIRKFVADYESTIRHST